MNIGNNKNSFNIKLRTKPLSKSVDKGVLEVLKTKSRNDPHLVNKREEKQDRKDVTVNRSSKHKRIKIKDTSMVKTLYNFLKLIEGKESPYPYNFYLI